MNRSQKLLFFVVAVLTMALFAVASIEMAQNHWGFGFILILLAFIATGFGFVLRRRLLKTVSHSSPNPKANV